MHDGGEDRCNAIDDGHQASSDGLEERLDLKSQLVREVMLGRNVHTQDTTAPILNDDKTDTFVLT